MRGILRAIASVPAPSIPGLRSRYWRAERRAIRGIYVFDDSESADAFARDPLRDPASSLLGNFESESAGEIPRTDVFDRPIFIIAAPRAGSTLLYELLVRSPQLFSLDGESHGPIEGIAALHPATRAFESHRLADIDADDSAVAALRAGIVADVRDHRGKRFLAYDPASRPARIRLIEKTPENSLRVPFLQRAFPDARFIFLHRDARQNVSSLAEAWNHDGFVNIPELPGWDRHRWCFLLPPEWRALNGRSLSDVSAFQWRAANQFATDDLEALPRDRWTSIDYNELVAAPGQVVQKLCDFLGIDFDAQLADALSRPLPLSSTTITPPSPIKWRSNRSLDRSSLEGLGPIEGRLRNLMVRATPPRKEPARVAAVRFACFVDDATTDSAPRRAAGTIVNPSFQFQLGATVPIPLVRRARCRERFLADHPILWVEDPATRVLCPFFARRSQVRTLLGLQAGETPRPFDSPLLEASLEAAGILTTASELDARREAGETLVGRARKDLGDDRFCKLPSLIHPLQIRTLAAYYRRLIESGWVLGDDQVERRHGWHNESVARFFHHQLTDFVSRVAGEPVKPAYSYSSAYRGSAALGAHMDRRQCEYTLSLLVDHSSASSPDPWPLWFLGPRGKVSVTLQPGDAVLFRGCELPHWRDAAPEDQDQIMLLFHWVPSDFAGVLD